VAPAKVNIKYPNGNAERLAQLSLRWRKHLPEPDIGAIVRLCPM